MRRFFTVCAALALVVGAIALPAAPVSAEPYINDEVGFAIEFPNGWRSQENQMGMTVISLAPLEGGKDKFSENVNVICEDLPAPMALKQYTDLSIDGLKQVLSKVKVHERTVVNLGDREAARIVYSHEYQGVAIKALVYCVVTDDRAYVLTCTAENGKYTKYVKQFEGIAETFAVTQAAGGQAEAGEAAPEDDHEDDHEEN